MIFEAMRVFWRYVGKSRVYELAKSRTMPELTMTVITAIETNGDGKPGV